MEIIKKLLGEYVFWFFACIVALITYFIMIFSGPSQPKICLNPSDFGQVLKYRLDVSSIPYSGIINNSSYLSSGQTSFWLDTGLITDGNELEVLTYGEWFPFGKANTPTTRGTTYISQQTDGEIKTVPIIDKSYVKCSMNTDIPAQLFSANPGKNYINRYKFNITNNTNYLMSYFDIKSNQYVLPELNSTVITQPMMDATGNPIVINPNTNNQVNLSQCQQLLDANNNPILDPINNLPLLNGLGTNPCVYKYKPITDPITGLYNYDVLFFYAVNHLNRYNNNYHQTFYNYDLMNYFSGNNVLASSSIMSDCINGINCTENNIVNNNSQPCSLDRGQGIYMKIGNNTMNGRDLQYAFHLANHLVPQVIKSCTVDPSNSAIKICNYSFAKDSNGNIVVLQVPFTLPVKVYDWNADINTTPDIRNSNIPLIYATNHSTKFYQDGLNITNYYFTRNVRADNCNVANPPEGCMNLNNYDISNGAFYKNNVGEWHYNFNPISKLDSSNNKVYTNSNTSIPEQRVCIFDVIQNTNAITEHPSEVCAPPANQHIYLKLGTPNYGAADGEVTIIFNSGVKNQANGFSFDIIEKFLYSIIGPFWGVKKNPITISSLIAKNTTTGSMNISSSYNSNADPTMQIVFTSPIVVSIKNNDLYINQASSYTSFLNSGSTASNASFLPININNAAFIRLINPSDNSILMPSANWFTYTLNNSTSEATLVIIPKVICTVDQVSSNNTASCGLDRYNFYKQYGFDYFEQYQLSFNNLNMVDVNISSSNFLDTSNMNAGLFVQIRNLILGMSVFQEMRFLFVIWTMLVYGFEILIGKRQITFSTMKSDFLRFYFLVFLTDKENYYFLDDIIIPFFINGITSLSGFFLSAASSIMGTSINFQNPYDFFNQILTMFISREFYYKVMSLSLNYTIYLFFIIFPFIGSSVLQMIKIIIGNIFFLILGLLNLGFLITFSPFFVAISFLESRKVAFQNWLQIWKSEFLNLAISISIFGLCFGIVSSQLFNILRFSCCYQDYSAISLGTYTLPIKGWVPYTALTVSQLFYKLVVLYFFSQMLEKLSSLGQSIANNLVGGGKFINMEAGRKQFNDAIGEIKELGSEVLEAVTKQSEKPKKLSGADEKRLEQQEDDLRENAKDLSRQERNQLTQMLKKDTLNGGKTMEQLEALNKEKQNAKTEEEKNKIEAKKRELYKTLAEKNGDKVLASKLQKGADELKKTDVEKKKEELEKKKGELSTKRQTDDKKSKELLNRQKELEKKLKEEKDPKKKALLEKDLKKLKEEREAIKINLKKTNKSLDKIGKELKIIKIKADGKKNIDDKKQKTSRDGKGGVNNKNNVKRGQGVGGIQEGKKKVLRKDGFTAESKKTISRPVPDTNKDIKSSEKGIGVLSAAGKTTGLMNEKIVPKEEISRKPTGIKLAPLDVAKEKEKLVQDRQERQKKIPGQVDRQVERGSGIEKKPTEITSKLKDTKTDTKTNIKKTNTKNIEIDKGKFKGSEKAKSVRERRELLRKNNEENSIFAKTIFKKEIEIERSKPEQEPKSSEPKPKTKFEKWFEKMLEKLLNSLENSIKSLLPEDLIKNIEESNKKIVQATESIQNGFNKLSNFADRVSKEGFTGALKGELNHSNESDSNISRKIKEDLERIDKKETQDKRFKTALEASDTRYKKYQNDLQTIDKKLLDAKRELSKIGRDEKLNKETATMTKDRPKDAELAKGDKKDGEKVIDLSKKDNSKLELERKIKSLEREKSKAQQNLHNENRISNQIAFAKHKEEERREADSLHAKLAREIFGGDSDKKEDAGTIIANFFAKQYEKLGNAIKETLKEVTGIAAMQRGINSISEWATRTAENLDESVKTISSYVERGGLIGDIQETLHQVQIDRKILGGDKRSRDEIGRGLLAESDYLKRSEEYLDKTQENAAKIRQDFEERSKKTIDQQVKTDEKIKEPIKIDFDKDTGFKQQIEDDGVQKKRFDSEINSNQKQVLSELKTIVSEEQRNDNVNKKIDEIQFEKMGTDEWHDAMTNLFKEPPIEEPKDVSDYKPVQSSPMQSYDSYEEQVKYSSSGEKVETVNVPEASGATTEAEVTGATSSASVDGATGEVNVQGATSSAEIGAFSVDIPVDDPENSDDARRKEDEQEKKEKLDKKLEQLEELKKYKDAKKDE